MLGAPLSPEKKLERGIELKGIAAAASDLANAGANDLEVQTFVQGAKRKLAEVNPDTEKMGEAVIAAKKYKDQASRGR